MSALVCPLWRPSPPPPIADQIDARTGARLWPSAIECQFRHRHDGTIFDGTGWDTAALARVFRCTTHNRRPFAYVDEYNARTRRLKLAELDNTLTLAYNPTVPEAVTHAEHVRDRTWSPSPILPFPWDGWPDRVNTWDQTEFVWIPNRPPSPTLHTGW